MMNLPLRKTPTVFLDLWASLETPVSFGMVLGLYYVLMQNWHKFGSFYGVPPVVSLIYCSKFDILFVQNQKIITELSNFLYK